MKQTIDEILANYYEGKTTLAEEKYLRAFFQQNPIPEHLQHHADQFRYFAAARADQPSLEFTNQLAKKLTMPKPGRVISLATRSLRIAASVGLIMLGFGGGLLYDRWHTQPTALLSALAGQPAPVDAIKKVLAFEQLPKTSASERIQAVNQSYDLAQGDQGITQLLINTLNFDANVNVRLAACQALLRFESEPGVREALIQSLTIQTDPNIQITLFLLVVGIKEKRAIYEMQRLAQSRQALDVVRMKAREGIAQLGQDAKTSA